ncbi:MAG TPA: decaprenylphospho-beta-D-erythro-pentofuranosid-2-ulose 2-reductase [Acidimicrobiales bacterium]|jgi:decaprenylphospho-beta-D-erythro-pentofuranosid-2-ulose 2-reductase|nr:decaprenylphospho-beta-D-erythro-pentofuranosid-2-ulose 2-reductase [Acidimicrobiales bacterium]
MRDALGSPQSVLVLGGTSDIGLATAKALVSRRARTVVLAGRRPEALEEAAAEVRRLGAERVETVAFDADDTASHARFAEEVFSKFGDIDVVLVAFGVLADQARAEEHPEEAVGVFTTNFVGAASIGLHVSHHLRRQGHGVLVLLSSVAAERARRSNFVYGSSKAGVDAFYTGLGDSLVGTGVSVLIVRPGFVKTKMTEGMQPAPLSTTADEVAEVIVRALESGAEEVWAPRPLRAVMSVLRHVPRPVFRRLPL